MSAEHFSSLYTHGLVRLAVATPRVAVGDPAANAEATLALAREADAKGAAAALFPELGITGYAIDDLHLQGALQDAAIDAIQAIKAASSDLQPLILVGAPLARAGRLYNCAVVIHRGAILGVVPKTYLPNYREFYEKRWFASGRDARGLTIQVGEDEVPFGVDLLFPCRDVRDFTVHVEICEDLWAPVAPSEAGALAGATVLLNLSASNITIGKAETRKLLCAAQSLRLQAAYAYSAAGYGESTTDLAWDGQAAIHENGALLAEAERFALHGQVTYADVDVERLALERLRTPTFADAASIQGEPERSFRKIGFDLAPRRDDIGLIRDLRRFPFVPADPARLDADCYEAYNIQVHGLMKRMEATGSKKLVIGVSGGLDSTHALIVAAKAFDRLGLPRENILAFTLPGFATGERSKGAAWALMRALGVSAEEIDIRPAARRMLEDLGHPFAGGEPVYDITFENVQAGLRTDYLFRAANQRGGMVLGTGDLSELALGWCTYGVGDQMSHYNVNGSVSKTLIQHLIRWTIRTKAFDDATSAVLQGIVEAVISPELIPAGEGGEEQSTEATVGPYALQDFNLYYITRYGLRPSKVAFLAHHAWGDAARGDWPEGVEHRAYSLEEIKAWLRVFLHRFFTTSQFKRSAMPNGPKVTSGGSLSPRGDWRAPSDGNARAWLAELEANVP